MSYTNLRMQTERFDTLKVSFTVLDLSFYMTNTSLRMPNAILHTSVSSFEKLYPTLVIFYSKQQLYYDGYNMPNFDMQNSRLCLLTSSVVHQTPTLACINFVYLTIVCQMVASIF